MRVEGAVHRRSDREEVRHLRESVRRDQGPREDRTILFQAVLRGGHARARQRRHGVLCLRRRIQTQPVPSAVRQPMLQRRVPIQTETRSDSFRRLSSIVAGQERSAQEGVRTLRIRRRPGDPCRPSSRQEPRQQRDRQPRDAVPELPCDRTSSRPLAAAVLVAGFSGLTEGDRSRDFGRFSGSFLGRDVRRDRRARLARAPRHQMPPGRISPGARTSSGPTRPRSRRA